jgi:hypothetical protein
MLDAKTSLGPPSVGEDNVSRSSASGSNSKTLTSRRQSLKHFFPPTIPSESIPPRCKQLRPDYRSNGKRTHSQLKITPVPVEKVQAPVQPRGQETEATTPSSGVSSDLNPLKAPACEPTVIRCESDCSTTNAPSPSHSDMPHSTGVTYIRTFLRNCIPSLEHILSRFIDLGFHSPNILRDVACYWTDNECRELMKQIAPGRNGIRMTELELFALERGLHALRRTTSTSIGIPSREHL